MLPPPRSKNAGALQPSATRRLITPLPPRPPTMNPPFHTLGKTATASARSSKSCGIDLSRVAMIWLNIRAALSDCAAASRALPILRSRLVCAFSNDVVLSRKAIAMNTKNGLVILFMLVLIQNNLELKPPAKMPVNRRQDACAPSLMPRRISRQGARENPHGRGHLRQSHGRTRQQEFA